MKKNNNNWYNILIVLLRYMALIAVVWLAIAMFTGGTSNPFSSAGKLQETPYSQLVQHILSDNVKELNINSDKFVAEATLKNGDTKTVSNVPINELNAVVTQYTAENMGAMTVNYKAKSNPNFVNIITTLIMVGLMGFLIYFMFAQQGGGNSKVMNFGKSKAKLADPEAKKVTFKDVAGADEEKAELEEIVDFLKAPRRYTELGAKIPKGFLLVGPPGTGKTLLAKATAGEAKVPFFSISGSDFVEMFVGVGASRVRDLFETAKKNSPCIVFIDEIDAVGRQRGAGLGGGNDEREQTLNQLLVEMDGFSNQEGIIIIAATNRADILDPAILRPGRFDRQIMVSPPDVKGREEILKVHSKGKPLAENIDFSIIAKATVGFTGADLANIMNESSLLAARHRRKVIEMYDIEEAIKRVIAGPEKKSRVVTKEDKEITAYHEIGHAIISQVLPHTDRVHEISIIPRGMAAGYNLTLPENDNSHMLKNKFLDSITMLLGGRAAEEVMLNDISAGASNDIERATKIARSMVTEYGMSEILGPMNLGSEGDDVFLGRDFLRSRNYGEEVASAIDREVRDIITSCHEKAIQILTDNKDKLEVITRKLIEKETLTGDEFEELFKNGSLKSDNSESEEASNAANTDSAKKTKDIPKDKKSAFFERFGGDSDNNDE